MFLKKYFLKKYLCTIAISKNKFSKLLSQQKNFQNYHLKKFKFASTKIHFQKSFLEKMFFKNCSFK